jgi:hypothetical protein
MSDQNPFREWMDARGFKADDVAAKFKVSPQTISHWRSQGVPDRRQSEVRYIMTTWAQVDHTMIDPRQSLTLRPTADQFDLWNDAAMAAGLRISDWAMKGLDSMAKDWERKPRIVDETPAEREERWLRENSAKVAEEGK